MFSFRKFSLQLLNKTLENLALKLRTVLDTVSNKLHMLSDDRVSTKPAPDAWSKKEILGHLIDSAANNHRRFMLAQFKNNLVFDGYLQERWVEYQDYQNANWTKLVTLFLEYNTHLCRVIDNIPSGVLNKQHDDHNLHLVAFRTVPQGEATSLAYFIDDYINHVQHHIDQILKEG